MKRTFYDLINDQVPLEYHQAKLHIYFNNWHRKTRIMVYSLVEQLLLLIVTIILAIIGVVYVNFWVAGGITIFAYLVNYRLNIRDDPVIWRNNQEQSISRNRLTYEMWRPQFFIKEYTQIHPETIIQFKCMKLKELIDSRQIDQICIAIDTGLKKNYDNTVQIWNTILQYSARDPILKDISRKLLEIINNKDILLNSEDILIRIKHCFTSIIIKQ